MRRRTISALSPPAPLENVPINQGFEPPAVAGAGVPAWADANRPGTAPAPGVDGLVSLFGAAVASGELLVLDGGVLGNVPPSTIVDCTTSVPLMIREGAIPRAELRRHAGRLAP